LKKNNVSVDIVNFGESEENTDLLEKFVNTVKANDNSNLVTVEPGKLLSDVVASSPIFHRGGGQISEFSGLGGGQDADLQAAIRASQGDSGGAASGGAAFGGVDPNTDPELAMALRMSMEEERQRQEAEAKRAADEDGDAAAAANESGAASSDAAPSGGDASGSAEAAKMAQALDIDEEDEELMKALEMSMAEDDDNADVDMGDADIRDENFVDELLDGLPGIDAQDMAEIANMDDLLEAVDDDDDGDKEQDDSSKKEKDSDKK